MQQRSLAGVGAQSTSKWTPPPAGMVKINSDGAVFTELESLGVGVALRDEKGFVLACLAEKMKMLPDPHLAEIMGVLKGLQLALDLGFCKAIIEGDASNVMKTLTSSQDDYGPFDHLLDDAKLLMSHFHFISVSHINRKANMVAHRLGKFSKGVSEPLIWMEDGPPCIFDAVNVDVVGIPTA